MQLRYTSLLITGSFSEAFLVDTSLKFPYYEQGVRVQFKESITCYQNTQLPTKILSMPKRGLLAGNKITKNHSTIIDDAVKLIEYCKTIEEVKMIVPSEIVSLKQAPRHLKFTPIQAGWKLAVRGFNARQIIYIYTSEPEVVKDLIEKWSTKFLVGCR